MPVSAVSEIVDAFDQWCARDPERRVVHLPALGTALTAQRVWQSHLTWCDRFRLAGLEPGHLVISTVGNRAAVVPMFLAARACGLVWMAAEIGATDAEIAHLRTCYGAAAMLFSEPPGADESLAGRIEVHDHLSDATRYQDVAVMKLTSGSTGIPRATRTTEAQLVADTRNIQAAMDILPLDTQMATISLSHAYGMSVVLMPLLLQGTAIALRESFAPEQWPTDAARCGINSFPGVPFMFQHFLDKASEGWPPGVRRITSAGAPLPLDTARAFRQRFGVKIRSFYGTTESGGITYDGSDDVDEDTVGTPLPGVSVTLVGDSGTGPGNRVHVRSTAVSNGYVASANDGFCDGGYLTGDYGAFDEGGRLRLTGRVSPFVNVAGRKVQPVEVEQVLRSMPGISDVRVVAGVDRRRGQQVVACIVADPERGAAPAPVDVRRYCGQRLAAHKVPRAFVFLTKMPLTPRGKLDRQALEALVRAELDRMP